MNWVNKHVRMRLNFLFLFEDFYFFLLIYKQMKLKKSKKKQPMLEVNQKRKEKKYYLIIQIFQGPNGFNMNQLNENYNQGWH